MASKLIPFYIPDGSGDIDVGLVSVDEGAASVDKGEVCGGEVVATIPSGGHEAPLSWTVTSARCTQLES